MSIVFVNQNAIDFLNTSERYFFKSLFHFWQSFHFSAERTEYSSEYQVRKWVESEMQQSWMVPLHSVLILHCWCSLLSPQGGEGNVQMYYLSCCDRLNLTCCQILCVLISFSH